MSDDHKAGGCQCGAVRYSIAGRLTEPSICHCRMCQKAFGSFFAPLVGVAFADFTLTRGEIAVFTSSDQTERGFCRNCGTPLTFRQIETDQIEVSIGSLDQPMLVKPVKQVGTESRLSWFERLADLPDASTGNSEKANRMRRIAETNRQHPDHDTGSWTPALSGGRNRW